MGKLLNTFLNLMNGVFSGYYRFSVLFIHTGFYI